MISNLHRNHMGTTSFDGKFTGMRKPQDFIVYPLHSGNDASRITVQSGTRIGTIDLATGHVRMSAPRAGGAYGVHKPSPTSLPCDTLDAELLLLLKGHILDSASGKAGTNGVIYTDNSGALEVFGDAA